MIICYSRNKTITTTTTTVVTGVRVTVTLNVQNSLKVYDVAMVTNMPTAPHQLLGILTLVY